ncbi:MAG: flagellar basal body P-ring protein FlgI [Planctomycetes bacterium]|nr:flagellar basal body P-ring protein FlgI [Planctomycetota bacterium]
MRTNVNTAMCRGMRRAAAMLVAACILSQSVASAQVRVGDVAKLKGQRTNKLMGFGLVVGLSGTGDGGEVNTTRRALIALHKRYAQPVLDIDELNASNVALVVVEASIPEHGAREGETTDVIVSALNGSTKSLKGGQLLMTPLQDASLTIPDIIAVAGGRVELNDPDIPTRGIIRLGATFEEDFLYTFIENGYVTLVLHEARASWAMADIIARAVNQELRSLNNTYEDTIPGRRRNEVEPDAAFALGPKNIRVKIPSWELPKPAWAISQILNTPLFVLPPQEARVVINRTTGRITVSGTVTISPTVLLIPGLGTVTVGGGEQASNSGVVGLDTQKIGGTEFQELLETLSRLKLSGKQMVETIQHLERVGSLSARLIYTE